MATKLSGDLARVLAIGCPVLLNTVTLLNCPSCMLSLQTPVRLLDRRDDPSSATGVLLHVECPHGKRVWLDASHFSFKWK